MSRSVVKRTSDEGSGNEELYNDINVLSKALYGDNKTRPRIVNSTASSRSKSVAKPQFPDTTRSKSKVSSNEDRFLKDKKSIWSWNSLKSFTHVRNKRFNCCFSLQVHSIEGLPPSFDNLTICVKWKRRDGELMTRPATVTQGVAEFEQLLTNTCWVYGSRSGPHHSAKYEAKHFLLYAFVYGDDVDPEVDLGKHRVDLTRLLPLTLEELEDEKSSGKWTTSYRLSGLAKGATMNVSFGYSVVDNNAKSPAKSSGLKRGESLPSFNRSVEDIKDLHEVLPVSKSELSDSVSMLYKKLEEEEDKSVITDDHETQPDAQSEVKNPYPDPDADYRNAIGELSVLNQGIEISSKENVIQKQDESVREEQKFDDKELLLQELELALSNVVDLKDEFDSQEEIENLKKEEDDDHDDILCNSTESGFGYEESVKTGYVEKGKSVNLDYTTESVTDEFLNMLKMEQQSPLTLTSGSESNSPRERLLRQFEKDSMANGSSSLFNFNIDDDDVYDETGCFISDPSSASTWGPIPIPEEEEAPNKTKASILEDLETEALMREWGLNENVFQRSPPKVPIVEISREEPLELPPLGEGLGPFVQTNNGGFLRSMNPEIFKNAKSGGNLIMQVSSPVVVPAEMGSGIMDVLQCLASVGIEKLSKQANKLMPLEDISGKTIQQMAWESMSSFEALQMKESLQQEAVVGQYAADESSVGSSGRRLKKYDLGAVDQEYVSLEDLAPLAMNKIEALSMEGLRIQSGMSDKDAPSNISPQSIGEISALEGKRVNFDGSLGLEGTGGLQLVNVKNSSEGHDDDDDDDMEGIMGLSVTLDEWMRLDSGEMDDGDEMSERTSKILAAHHASDLMRARRGKVKGKGSKKGGGGLLGNNFTVALMVQLRDPLRNFEPVGTPMLALVQVERVFVPPKPKIYSSIFSLWNKPEEEEVKKDELKVETEKVVEKEKVKVDEEDESVLVGQFKITEVHIAGVKSEVEPSKKKKAIWGSNAKQEQAGSRWLVANGMGKKNTKHPLMKSKGGGGGGSLWSISSKGKKGSSSSVVKEEDTTVVRNPNVIIPNQTVKLLSGAGFV